MYLTKEYLENYAGFTLTVVSSSTARITLIHKKWYIPNTRINYKVKKTQYYEQGEVWTRTDIPDSCIEMAKYLDNYFNNRDTNNVQPIETKD